MRYTHLIEFCGNGVIYLFKSKKYRTFKFVSELSNNEDFWLFIFLFLQEITDAFYVNQQNVSSITSITINQ